MKKYQIDNPGEMAANIVNCLYGASMAMRSGHLMILRTTFMTAQKVCFETNDLNFVSAYRAELSNYNLEIKQVNE